MQESLVSVVTPAYNSARFILGAIDSVQAQTYSEWEMLVVDDCSQDDTRELVEGKVREDDRIRLIPLSENSGAAVARNAALEAARGRYVAFLDSDDLWLPTKLEEQLAFMKEMDSAFSFTSYRMIGEGGEVLGEPVHTPELMGYRDLLKNAAIGCLTVVLDRSRTGPLDTSSTGDKNHDRIFDGHEDYILWYRPLRSGLVAHGLQRDLARYRIVEGSLSRNKLRVAYKAWRLYREVEGLSLPYAAWCFSNYAVRAYLKNRR